MNNNQPATINMIVEIPKGTTNKYEFDLKTNQFLLDRPLFGANFYPGEYGFIADTLDYDGDCLDIISLITYPTFPGCQVEIRILGAIDMIDGGEIDTKIFGVVASDPRFNHYQSWKDVPEPILNEITNFFLQYKALQKKTVEIKGWLDINQAIKTITTCQKLYQKYQQQMLTLPKQDLVKLIQQNEQH